VGTAAGAYAAKNHRHAEVFGKIADLDQRLDPRLHYGAEVHLFHEYSDRDFIEKTVGEPVIKSKIEDQGRPVKAIGVSGDYLRAQDTRVSWPATVMLEPMGTGYLQLTP
jgi:hypothetical protein